MEPTQDELLQRSDQLYERFGKPLEGEHWGRFLAVSPEGETLLADDLDEVGLRALEQFGRGCFIFKVGEKAVGRIR